VNDTEVDSSNFVAVVIQHGSYPAMIVAINDYLFAHLARDACVVSASQGNMPTSAPNEILASQMTADTYGHTCV
jgi:hypothetical protein